MAQLQTTSITGSLSFSSAGALQLPQLTNAQTASYASVVGRWWYNSSTSKLNYSYCGVGSIGWSTGGALPASRWQGAGAGTTNTAALAVGGYSPTNPAVQRTVIAYNGTSWSSGGSMIATRRASAGSGTATSAMAVSGIVNGAAPGTGVETYNGTTWSTSTAIINGRYLNAANGASSTSTLAFSGVSGTCACVECWNGSTWANCTAMSIPRIQPGTGNTGGAASTQTVAVGGTTPSFGNPAFCTEVWNGTSWSSSGATIVARNAGIGAASSNTAVMAYSVSNLSSNATECFNGTSWATSCTMTNPRAYYAQSAGSATSGIAMGSGPYPTLLTCTELFNCTAGGLAVCSV